MNEQPTPELEEEEEQTAQQRQRRFMLLYIFGLFAVALVLILLSYLTQVRANEQVSTLQSEVDRQKQIAQGIASQVQELQQKMQEQQQKMDVQTDAIGKVRAQLQVPENESMVDAVDLLYQRYLALDALAQVERLLDQGAKQGAKNLLKKMMERHGKANLMPGADPDTAVLLGANAAEFQAICTRLGVA